MKRAVVALIDEARCIGCARCIDACPVDAIAGAQGFMHTVIAAYCTGCELCLPPCPVEALIWCRHPDPGRTRTQGPPSIAPRPGRIGSIK